MARGVTWASVVRVPLWCGLSAALLITLVWMVGVGPSRYIESIPVPPNGESWAISRNTPAELGCSTTVVLDTCIGEQFAWMLLPPAIAGLLAIALVWLEETDFKKGCKAGKQPQKPARAGWLERAAQAQLPPARFWSWWCGGLSMVDVGLVAVWMVINAVWLYKVLTK